jgi:hypothetical protein
VAAGRWPIQARFWLEWGWVRMMESIKNGEEAFNSPHNEKRVVWATCREAWGRWASPHPLFILDIRSNSTAGSYALAGRGKIPALVSLVCDAVCGIQEWWGCTSRAGTYTRII